MKTIDICRLCIAGLLLYFALNGKPEGIKLPLQQPYTGSLTKLHQEAAKMEAIDRQGLSEALSEASKMLASDQLGLVKKTDELQSFCLGAISYGYTTFAVKKYPDVAALIKAEIIKTVGTKSQTVTDDLRDKTVELLAEFSRAIK